MYGVCCDVTKQIMLYAVTSLNRYMLASVVKHAADVAMNFNRLYL